MRIWIIYLLFIINIFLGLKSLSPLLDRYLLMTPHAFNTIYVITNYGVLSYIGTDALLKNKMSIIKCLKKYDFFLGGAWSLCSLVMSLSTATTMIVWQKELSTQRDWMSEYLHRKPTHTIYTICIRHKRWLCTGTTAGKLFSN